MYLHVENTLHNEQESHTSQIECLMPWEKLDSYISLFLILEMSKSV